jgi:Flp pilus assembly protein CpaB
MRSRPTDDTRAPRRAHPLRTIATRTLWRSRFVLAAACVGLACSVVAGSLTPEPPQTAAVVVTARDVAAGSRLTSSDLRVTRVARALAPAAAYAHVSSAKGRTAAAGLTAGTVVTPGLVAGDEVARSAPDGKVVVALPEGEDPTVALLGPGDHVDLLTTTGHGSRYLAHRALVLPPPGRQSGSAGLLGGGDDPAATLVVAVDPGEAEAIAARTDGSRLTAVVVR